eukprot:4460575-Amphidinium_carterae.1
MLWLGESDQIGLITCDQSSVRCQRQRPSNTLVRLHAPAPTSVRVLDRSRIRTSGHYKTEARDGIA